MTVAAARQLAGRLVALCGVPLPERRRRSSKLTHAFPSPKRVAAADLESLGMPGARRATLMAMAVAALEAPALFLPQADRRRSGRTIPRDPRRRRMDGAVHRAAGPAPGGCLSRKRHWTLAWRGRRRHATHARRSAEAGRALAPLARLCGPAPLGLGRRGRQAVSPAAPEGEVSRRR